MGGEGQHEGRGEMGGAVCAGGYFEASPVYTTPHYTTPYHITPHHTTPHHTTSHHTTLHYTFLHSTFCQKPRPQHNGGVAGVGAAGDSRDDNIAMCQQVLLPLKQEGDLCLLVLRTDVKTLEPNLPAQTEQVGHSSNGMELSSGIMNNTGLWQ